MKSQTSSKMGHVRLKKLGQVLEKAFVHSIGHIFSLIIMKLGQNVCLEEISDDLEKRSFRVKN